MAHPSNGMNKGRYDLLALVILTIAPIAGPSARRKETGTLLLQLPRRTE